MERGESTGTAVSGSVSFVATPTLDITVSEDFGYQEPAKYFGSVLLNGALDESLREVNYNVDDAAMDFKDSWTQLKADWRPLRNVVVRNNFNVLTSNRFWKNAESYSYQPATGLVNRTDFILIHHDQLQLGEHVEATISSSLAGRANTTSVGFDYSWTRFQHTNNSPYGGASAVPLTNPNPGTFINLAGTSPEFRSRQDQYSVFAENRLALTGRFSAIGGVRIDRYDVDRLAQRLGTSSSRTFTPANWRGGAVFAVRPGLHRVWAVRHGHRCGEHAAHAEPGAATVRSHARAAGGSRRQAVAGERPRRMDLRRVSHRQGEAARSRPEQPDAPSADWPAVVARRRDVGVGERRHSGCAPTPAWRCSTPATTTSPKSSAAS